MTKETEEMSEMSNLGMAIELKGIAKGREQASIEHIKNLMDSMKWPAKKVMDAMKIPKSEQAHYAAMLDADNE